MVGIADTMAATTAEAGDGAVAGGAAIGHGMQAGVTPMGGDMVGVRDTGPGMDTLITIPTIPIRRATTGTRTAMRIRTRTQFRLNRG
jgi:hypothetical protein